MMIENAVRKILIIAALAGTSVLAFAASPERGSCDKLADEIKMGTAEQTAKLGAAGAYKFVKEYEYDDETGSYTELTNHVHFFKVSLKRNAKNGIAYSVWLTDQSDDSVFIDYIEAADPASEEGMAPFASFDEFVGGWGSMMVMKEDEWYIDPDDPSESDPSPWTYYIRIEGNPGSTATLHWQIGNQLPLGIEDNPKILPTITQEAGITAVTNFVKGETTYYHAADLEEGRRYIFATVGGTADNAYGVDFDGGEAVVYDKDGWNAPYNGSFALATDYADRYEICVSETATNRPDAQFQLRYKVLPTRPLSEHEFTPIEVGQEVTFTPGHQCLPGFNFYDMIIDQCLFKVPVEKGKTYSADTFGSATNLLMRVYDDKGNRVGESHIKGDGTYDVRCCFTATNTASWYVGVCQRMDDDEHDTPLAQNDVKLLVRPLALGESVEPDDWHDEGDPADDTYAGATMLDPVPHAVSTNTVAADIINADKATVPWHQLGRADWTDVFAINGRANITYAFAVEVDPSVADDVQTVVAGTVFILSGTSELSVSKTGDLEVGSDEPLRFTASRNATYYLRVKVRTGDGLDFPSYRIRAIACDAKTGSAQSLGRLKVKLCGTDLATWSLNSESVKYPSDASIVLPRLASGKHYTVKYGAVTGFATPAADKTVDVVAGQQAYREMWYYDKYDPKDDYVAGKGTDPKTGKSVTYGATVWSLSNKTNSQDHTLWRDDVADTFAIAGKDGCYYDIWLSNLKGEAGDEPDAVFSITNADFGVIVANTTTVHQINLPASKSKYILTVSHAQPGDPKHTAYRLSGFFANVGAIKFSAAEYKAKDNAAEVKLTVNRTAKDGKVCVRLWTENGSVMGRAHGKYAEDDPGYKFYHEDLTLVWENGDSKAKTVLVKLIPDRYPTFHDFERNFTVRMEDAFDGTEECYHASFAYDAKGGKFLNETKVVLTETAKKSPGTVQVVPGSDDIIDVKKPVFDVRADGTLRFDLARVDGDDGDIAVKVDTSALTGKKGDFEEIKWKDGDSGSRTVSVDVPPAADAKTSKKVTLKLSASSKDKPKFAASSVTVNVYNDKFLLAMADYAKALPKTCGYTIKEGKAGTWFVMDDGSFTNFTGVGALTFTATGPCLAIYKYVIHGEEAGGSLTVGPGKQDEAVIPDGAVWANFEYSFNGADGYETIYQAVQYGYGEPIVEDGADVKAKVSVGKLPDGIKLEQDKATGDWFVRGIPTKAGYYYAEIRDADQNVLTNCAFSVVALRSAVGTFNGLVETGDDNAGTNRLQSVGQVTLTTAANGKLSAKVAIAGKAYSFAATGFASAKPLDPEDEDSDVRLEAELIQVQKTKAEVFTNTLQVVLADMDLDDPEAWVTRATLELDMAALPDLKGSGFQENVSYKGRACRDNSKVADWVIGASKFAGYYTMALVPMNASVFELGEPGGNGYLTMTVDAKGKVKLTGALANGTAYSAASLVGNLDDVDGDPAVTVPLYVFKSPMVFGGWLTLRFPKEGRPFVTLQEGFGGDDDIRWISGDAAASYAGDGFDLSIAPAGGYYDTVASLQRHYLNYDFMLDFPFDDDLDILRDILKRNYGESYDFVAKANPVGMEISVIGDTVSAAKQVLVKDGATYDWEFCVNPANVKLTFKRATGIVTGTCDLWYEGQKSGKTTAAKLSGLKHAGVLVMARENDPEVLKMLPADVWTAGAVVIPQSFNEGGKSRKWNASFPFNVKAEELPGK